MLLRFRSGPALRARPAALNTQDAAARGRRRRAYTLGNFPRAARIHTCARVREATLPHRLSAAHTLAWPSRVFSFSLKHVCRTHTLVGSTHTHVTGPRGYILFLSQTHTYAGVLSLSLKHTYVTRRHTHAARIHTCAARAAGSTRAIRTACTSPKTQPSETRGHKEPVATKNGRSCIPPVQLLRFLPPQLPLAQGLE